MLILYIKHVPEYYIKDKKHYTHKQKPYIFRELSKLLLLTTHNKP